MTSQLDHANPRFRISLVVAQREIGQTEQAQDSLRRSLAPEPRHTQGGDPILEHELDGWREAV